MKISRLLTSLTAVMALTAASAAHSADIIVVNFDPPGVGFNDPTPVEPVGGNPGTTLGEQRLNVFAVAAQSWGAELQSDVPIFLGALFSPLACSPTSGVLGSAGPTSVFANFPGAKIDEIWYVGALADSLAGADLDPGFIDLIAFFNGDIGVNPDCLTGQNWYNGFDHDNDPTSEIDLLSVVMHEIAHGLGFLELISEGTGDPFIGRFDTYSVNMFDTTLGDTWDNLSSDERLFSQTNSGNLVWIGDSVTFEAPNVLGPRPSVTINRPKRLKGSYEAQDASFGAPLRENGGLTGKMVVVDDGTDVATDGCEPILNNVKGKIALIDRGACAFTTKVLNAEIAGAKGAIIVNNQPAGLPPMGGFDPAVTIPSVGVSFDDGSMFKAAAAKNIVGKLILDGAFLAGANQDGLVRLYAPNPVRPGSSKSHWDTGASPNLLMEPFINDDLAPTLFLDLTPALFEDIGWELQ
jgi:hypothetical protein